MESVSQLTVQSKFNPRLVSKWRVHMWLKLCGLLRNVGKGRLLLTHLTKGGIAAENYPWGL